MASQFDSTFILNNPALNWILKSEYDSSSSEHPTYYHFPNVETGEGHGMHVYKVANGLQWENSRRMLMRALNETNTKTLAIDTEGSSDLQHPAKLLQLGGPKGIVVLIFLDLLTEDRLHGGFPDSLKSILADPNLLKIGSGIWKDIQNLNFYRHCAVRPFLEIQNLITDPLKYFPNSNWSSDTTGLKSLSERLGIFMFPYKVLRLLGTAPLSWQSYKLTRAQTYYASMDIVSAYEGVRLFMDSYGSDRMSKICGEGAHYYATYRRYIQPYVDHTSLQSNKPEIEGRRHQVGYEDDASYNRYMLTMDNLYYMLKEKFARLARPTPVDDPVLEPPETLDDYLCPPAQ